MGIRKALRQLAPKVEELHRWTIRELIPFLMSTDADNVRQLSEHGATLEDHDNRIDVLGDLLPNVERRAFNAFAGTVVSAGTPDTAPGGGTVVLASNIMAVSPGETVRLEAEAITNIVPKYRSYYSAGLKLWYDDSLDANPANWVLMADGGALVDMGLSGSSESKEAISRLIAAVAEGIVIPPGKTILEINLTGFDPNLSGGWEIADPGGGASSSILRTHLIIS